MSDKVKFGFETTELIAMTNVNQEKEVIQSGEFFDNLYKLREEAIQNKIEEIKQVKELVESCCDYIVQQLKYEAQKIEYQYTMPLQTLNVYASFSAANYSFDEKELAN